MRPRTRFTIAFLLLQILPILAIGMVTLAYTFKVVVDGVVESSNLMTSQVYEQVRMTLGRAQGDPATTLQNDDALRELLGSMQAFGAAVVIARITDSSGKILVAANDGSEGQMQPDLPSLTELEKKTSRWWPFAVLSAFSGTDLYAATRPFDVNGKPFGTIYIAVTTALLADRIKQLAAAFGMIVVVDVILSLLATASLRRLLFQQLWPIPELLQPAHAVDESQEPQSAPDELSGLAERFNRLSREVHSEHNRWDTSRDGVFDIVRSIHDGVVLLDSAGSLLFANREAQSVLGFAKTATVEGHPLSILLRKSHPLVSMAEAALESGSEAQDVALSPGGNGDERASMLVSCFRLGSSRKPVGLLLLLRDMNAVRELESVVDYSNRLARLGGLISGVAHQLRSPLHGMNLRLELLRQDAIDGHDIEKHINRLRNEVDRLDQSVEALLRFMRPQELKLSRFVLNDLIGEVVGRVKSDRIRIESSYDLNLRPIQADRAMLSEAFANLVQNAVQAMPDGGALRIVTCEKEGMIELEIADQGVGIAPEHLDQVLSLYFTTKKGGSGLGLPLALRAIELNRGTLKIGSRVGEGTTCTVRFPPAPDDAPKLAASAT
ncbi:MAG: sensor histidine kinase [Candidatus Binataceae bacterium]